MIILPAIDILGGKCVRLFKGEYGTARQVASSAEETVKSFEKANGVPVPYVIKDRRPGDIATCYADPVKSAEVLGWKAQFDQTDMCRDTWNWQSKNPNGYDKE